MWCRRCCGKLQDLHRHHFVAPVRSSRRVRIPLGSIRRSSVFPSSRTLSLVHLFFIPYSIVFSSYDTPPLPHHSLLSSVPLSFPAICSVLCMHVYKILDRTASSLFLTHFSCSSSEIHHDKLNDRQVTEDCPAAFLLSSPSPSCLGLLITFPSELATYPTADCLHYSPCDRTGV